MTDAQAEAFEQTPSASVELTRLDWLDGLPAVADCLRPYQRSQVESVAQAMRDGFRRILVQGATGSGKTHIIAAIVAAAAEVGLPVLILATRSRLVRQLHDRLKAFGIRHGVVSAALPRLRDYSARVQIASADTLHRRAVVDRHIPMPSSAVVLFDEAHLATADTRLNLLDSYPGAVRIGFTATPARKSGRSLGAAFDCLLPGPGVRELTAAGVLVSTRIFNTPVVTEKELRAVPKDNDNDYQAGALGDLLSRPRLVGDILENWLRIAKGKRSLCFAVNKTHGAALLAEFQQAGIAAEMLTDQDDEATREEVIGRLETGQTLVVINCFLLSYGADIPSVECIVLARPTRSLSMYLQMVGRGLRPSPETGKTACILIDHGHCVENLGLPHFEFPWTLEAGRNVNTEAMARARTASTEAMRTCKECAAIWLTSEQGNRCPCCGWTAAPRSKPVRVQQADLEELADTHQLAATDARVVRFYQEAIGWNQKHKPAKWQEKPNSVRAACWYAAREKFKLAEDASRVRIGNFRRSRPRSTWPAT